MNKQEILKILDEILDEIQAMLTEEQGAKESNTMKKSKWTLQYIGSHFQSCRKN